MNTLLGVVVTFTFLAAWFNHLFTCFSESMWGFLIAGAIFFPIGIIHGFWLWFQ
jgi:hypothetical protein